MTAQSIQTGASALANPRLIEAALACLVVWIVLIEMGIYFWFRPAEKQAATLPVWSLKLPDQSAEFRELPVSEGIRTILNYDESRQAEWRDNTECAWQLYYFRWLPSQTRYRAVIAIDSARGHAPDICLRNVGMVLQTNLGTETLSMNGVHIRVVAERFLDQGRNFHVFSCYWEPNEWTQQTTPGTIMAVRSVLHALKIRDRGRNEKRVIKMGVWGKDSDESAQAAFKEYLKAMISR